MASALEAHHVTPLAKGGAAYDLANLATFCRGCHIEEHRGAAQICREFRLNPVAM
ncbi:MAG: HNH endonuclease [Boseongicola sp. SB0662_bin_57]|nr:HNH endonuclease [Boseongicola sp. SB0662_bin_57]